MKVEKYQFKPLVEEVISNQKEEQKFTLGILSALKKSDHLFKSGLHNVIQSKKQANDTISKEEHDENDTSNKVDFQKGYDLAVQELTLKHKVEMDSIKREYENSHSKLLKNIEISLNKLEQKGCNFIIEQKEKLYELIVSICQKLLLKEISDHCTEIIKNFLDEIFDSIKHEKLISVIVNSKSKESVVLYFQHVNSKVEANIIEDNSLLESDCVVEWNSGRVENLVSNRMEDISKLFFNNID